jgi:hypothetical protein
MAFSLPCFSIDPKMSRFTTDPVEESGRSAVLPLDRLQEGARKAAKWMDLIDSMDDDR